MSTVVVATVKSNTSSPPAFQNTSGTEIGTLCRAWVNFNGTGTVAIRAQFNVSSITDNGVGDYTVNFTTALADANYAAYMGGGSQIATGTRFFMEQHDSVLRSTTQLRVYSLQGNLNVADTAVFSVSIFR